MDVKRKTNIEQAIKIAQANKKELFTKKIDEELNDAIQFVLALDIKAGKIKVNAKVFYQAYLNWSSKPVTKQKFFLEMSPLFEHALLGNNTMYFLNYQPSELLRESAQ